MPRGHPGSPWRPTADTAVRLARWRHLCSLGGWTRQDIADDLGMTLVALDQMVCRARRHQHPDAVLHPTSVAWGESLAYLVDHNHARSQARRLAREARNQA